MSALAGIWRFDGRPQPDADCALMLAAQQIYGPHDGRQWCDGTLAMGRRLFRLLPEDIHDRQPLQSRDGRLTLVADIRLDNREDLAAELGFGLQEARQLCDAAILLESLDRWGESALTRLIGDFAFALWDGRAQRLLLARDFIGHRPLHYHWGRGFFAFASMPKGLHALAEIPYGPDEHLLAEYLVLIPRRGPRTFFRDIDRVEPAHIVTVTRDGISPRKYWEPKRPGGVRLRFSDYVEGLRYHVDQATQSRLRGANGAVAAHLSAGFDSTAVTATAARLLSSRGGKIVAFTAVPREGYDVQLPNNRFADEGPLAATTAAMYPNIEHVLVRSGHLSPLDGLDRSFYTCERPLLNLCNEVWLSAIYQAARQRKLNILLVGQLGNETTSYAGFELLPELLLTGRFARLWRETQGLKYKTGMRRRGVAVQTFGPFLPFWLWRWANRTFLGHELDVQDYSAIRCERFVDLNLAALARKRGIHFSDRPPRDSFAIRLGLINRVDHGDSHKGTLAAWGVDWRAPLSDRRLVEYCLGIPVDQYLVDGIPRALAKAAFSDRLPQAVLTARKKGYQAADWHEGLTAARGDVARELERLAACGAVRTALDIDRMKRFVDNWPTSGWEADDVQRSYRSALLRGISVGHFLRKASGAN